MDAVDRLLAIMARLRDPERGCPWDVEQSFATIAPHTIEEAYEVDDAIRRGDLDALREELGDLLLQVVFHAQMAREAGHFDFGAVAEGLADKLVRRHPHVFARESGEAALDSADRVRTRWEEIKAQERTAAAETKTLLSGIAPALPALVRAYHIGVRAASVGFEWPTAGQVVDKIQEEVNEIREVVAAEGAMDHARAEEEMGDLLFAISNLARKLGIEPETALRKANDKFTRRFTVLEKTVAASGRSMQDVTLDELEAIWQRQKQEQ